MITARSTPTRQVRADDLRQHIEDTRLFWVFRHGRHQRRAWNELTDTEKRQQIEARRREHYCTVFDIY